MYDALIPIGPIMVRIEEHFTSHFCIDIVPFQLAMSAASPIWRGYLADVDCRWNVIAGSVDDRTPEERGLLVSDFLVVVLFCFNTL